MKELDWRAVIAIHGYCVARETESDAECIVAPGCFTTARFSKAAIQKKRRFITAALSQLPDAFREPGGASIRDAMWNRDGEVWVANQNWHTELDALIQLGVAAGMVELHMPSGKDKDPSFRVILP